MNLYKSFMTHHVNHIKYENRFIFYSKDLNNEASGCAFNHIILVSITNLPFQIFAVIFLIIISVLYILIRSLFVLILFADKNDGYLLNN